MAVSRASLCSDFEIGNAEIHPRRIAIYPAIKILLRETPYKVVSLPLIRCFKFIASRAKY